MLKQYALVICICHNHLIFVLDDHDTKENVNINQIIILCISDTFCPEINTYPYYRSINCTHRNIFTGKIALTLYSIITPFDAFEISCF